MSKKLTLGIYAVGGCGVNSGLNSNIPSKLAGYPETTISYVDTSDSNLPTDVDKKDVYLIPGVKGAGKDRRLAHEVGVSHVNKILLKHPPKNTNIVIFSLSGGTGSVLAPLLISELIKRGEQVIAFVVTSTASQKESDNALATIGTLQNISLNILKAPIVAKFYTNGNETSRKEVDDLIEEDLRYVALLTSGLNVELDHQDVNNLLRYDKSTTVPFQLVDLLIYPTNTTQPIPVDKAIAVANLLTSSADSELSLGQAYSATGFLPQEALNATDHKISPVHYIVTNQLIANRIEELKGVVANYKNVVDSLKTPPIVFETSTEDGFLF